MRKQIVKARFSGGSFSNPAAVVATVQKMRAHAKDPTAYATKLAGELAGCSASRDMVDA